MPDWLGGILVVAAIFGAVSAWEAAKERTKKRGGRLERTVDALEGAGETAGNGFHTILQKGGGVVMGVLGVWAFFSLFAEGFAWWRLGGLVLIGYAIYLLWPGRRSFIAFF
ncbi:MAG TPA: hypothetical protein VFC82_03970 [Actinomycetaceae bacterium]|nr:hypothetical protein [Actinomycetaceae bacterium]